MIAPRHAAEAGSFDYKDRLTQVYHYYTVGAAESMEEPGMRRGGGSDMVYRETLAVETYVLGAVGMIDVLGAAGTIGGAC